MTEELTFCIDQNSDAFDYRLLTVDLFKVSSNAHFGSLKYSSGQTRCILLLLGMTHGDMRSLTTGASHKIPHGMSEKN